jgi:acyl-CoA reductase-like NAD-dependent aldehyde dehydrogenase
MSISKELLEQRFARWKVIEMNALELADWCDDLFSSDGEPKKAAAMLRKQDAAIRQLREALDGVLYWDNGKPEWDEARAALAATEEYK